MFQEIHIKNFKSIADDTISLGRVNVFIGENGCGKSNILEAMAFLSAALEARLDNENLLSKGIRLAKPALMMSSFKGKKTPTKIIIAYQLTVKEHSISHSFEFKTENQEANLTRWKYDYPFSAKDSLNPKYGEDFVIYLPNTPALRGVTSESHKEPIGIYGENLDVLIANFDKEERAELQNYNYLIDWLSDFFVDTSDQIKLRGFKPNRSQSTLYFLDKYMMTKNNMFSSENANEGVLHLLFYLAVMISKKTPPVFAIDNIESCLNPHLCRHLMKEICDLAKKHHKQLLITTHNPAILDGLNLHDDDIRLFEVKRLDNGNTKTRRIKLKPPHEEQEERRLKLSELWTRGYLGAIPKNF